MTPSRATRSSAATTYYYAIRARNANGLSEPSDTVTARTHPAPSQPEIAPQVAGADFTLDGEDLDTTGACSESDIAAIAAGCTINIYATAATFAVEGMLDTDDRLSLRIGRDKTAVDSATAVANAGDLRGTDQTVTLTFEVGRNLLRLWGDEDNAGTGEEHFFRVNVVPYWELSGNRLSKSDDCQSTTARTAAQITDDDCIVTQVSMVGNLGKSLTTHPLLPHPEPDVKGFAVQSPKSFYWVTENVRNSSHSSSDNTTRFGAGCRRQRPSLTTRLTLRRSSAFLRALRVS